MVLQIAHGEVAERVGLAEVAMLEDYSRAVFLLSDLSVDGAVDQVTSVSWDQIYECVT